MKRIFVCFLVLLSLTACSIIPLPLASDGRNVSGMPSPLESPSDDVSTPPLGSPSDSAPPTEILAPSISSLPSLNPDWVEIYDEILSQYKDVMKSGEIDLDNLGNDVNENSILYAPRGSGRTFYYALYDIDENGVPELIIGCGAEGNIAQYDIFTYKDGVIINVFKDVYKDKYIGNPGFGFDFFFTLQQNSIIAVNGYVGTGWQTNEFYRISLNGHAELIEGILIDINFIATEGRTIYRPYADLSDNYYYNPEMTKEEYNNIIKKYVNNDIDKNSIILDWIQLQI